MKGSVKGEEETCLLLGSIYFYLLRTTRNVHQEVYRTDMRRVRNVTRMSRVERITLLHRCKVLQRCCAPFRRFD